jgi:hypothetical protein
VLSVIYKHTAGIWLSWSKTTNCKDSCLLGCYVILTDKQLLTFECVTVLWHISDYFTRHCGIKKNDICWATPLLEFQISCNGLLLREPWAQSSVRSMCRFFFWHAETITSAKHKTVWLQGICAHIKLQVLLLLIVSMTTMSLGVKEPILWGSLT